MIDLFAPRGRVGEHPSIADNIDASGDCWQWIGNIQTGGYGQTYIDGKPRLAHRVVWETLVGKIPENLELDHLCRNSACVNPDHLEPVTHRENVRRGVAGGSANKAKTHCKHGHPFSGDNLIIEKRSSVFRRRRCRTCHNKHRGETL